MHKIVHSCSRKSALNGFSTTVKTLWNSGTFNLTNHTSSYAFSLHSNNHSSQVCLPQIKGSDIDMLEHSYNINIKTSDALRKNYNELVAQAHQGGGERGIKRHVERNKKIIVRERLRMLLDPQSPAIEIGTIAGHDMDYGTIPSAGAVVMIGKIHGTWCMVTANDATVKGGSIYPITLKKQLRSQQIAQENCLPSIFLVDSGGAFLPLQSEIFNPGGKTFYNQAVMSSEGIPQIAFVCGSCTAGAAYIPTMAQEAVILDKIGTIFLGGPPLVQAATGERVTPEELGGADLHCRLSGCTDHFVESEEDGLNTVRNIIATSNSPKVSTEPCKNEVDISEISKYVASNTENSVKAHDIIKCLADNGGFHEYKEKYGATIVAGFMYVNGSLVGVIANDGYLTENAAKKGSNFVQLCGVRQIPILFLQNMTSDETDASEELQSTSIKARATFMQSVATCPSPKLVISVGGLVGSPHLHPMCSLSMGARFHFVWPNVRSGVEFLYNTDTKRSQSEYEELKRKSTAFYGASQLWYDGIVLPEDTKEVIYLCLNVFEHERAARLQKANNQILAEGGAVHTVLRM